MGSIMQLADSSLYEIFSEVDSKYKVMPCTRIIFPKIQTLRNHVNLLTRFPSKIGTDNLFDNVNLLYKDLSFLLRTAVKEFPTFESDIKQLLGGDV